MPNGRIKLVIAESSPEMCEMLTDLFGTTSDIELCATAGDGESALEQVALCRPDVLLLDLILPKLDGLAVLEKLGNTQMQRKPAVLVVSALTQEAVVSRAIALGAAFYTPKPYNPPDLLSRIRLIADTDCELMPARERKIRKMACRLTMNCGIHTNLLGYRYCVGALEMMAGREEHCMIVKTVYTDLAEQNETTPQCVENALRTAIRKAYKSGSPVMCRLMAEAGCPAGKTPPNGRFLTILSERIKMEL